MKFKTLLTYSLLPLQLLSTFSVSGNGSVVSWGNSAAGGSGPSLHNYYPELSSGITEIYSSHQGFVATNDDGLAVYWGGSNPEGSDGWGISISGRTDSRPEYAQELLSSGVIDVASCNWFFAALKDDGSVILMPSDYPAYYGDQGSLRSGVSKIYPLGMGSSLNSTINAPTPMFAALKTNGSVVCFGSSSSRVNYLNSQISELSGVSEICSNLTVFAALKTDGSVFTWGGYGTGAYGEDISSVSSQLSSGVRKVFSNVTSFAALKYNGSVITWGSASDTNSGGDSSSVASELSSGVTEICSTDFAYAALKNDGSVVTWGSANYGGNSSSVASQLSSGVTKIYAGTTAFAALKDDGSVVTWGSGSAGSDSSSVASELSSGVIEIYSTPGAFAALKDDGSVVTWGSESSGGDSSSVASELSSGVIEICSTQKAFAALKVDGSVVTWGSSGYGGNSSSVASQLSSGVTKIYASSKAFAALKLPVTPVIPVLENLEAFYESGLNENILIDVTPVPESPYQSTDYSFQWYYNDYAIPPLFDGTNSSYTISGSESSNGTWRVEITYPLGIASAEFEYRVFTDADGDGLSDYRESNLIGTNPSRSDTDYDTINDGDEVNEYLTNPLSSDTDGDGLRDDAEIITYGTDPFLNADFDSDGLSDAVEILTHNTDPKDTDSDDDQLSDAAEVNTHLTDPNHSDSDSDQLLDYAEIYTHLTDPNDSDSDNDGLNDYLEIITYSSDPNDPDSDDDGLDDGIEINSYSSNPNDSDTDNDGLADGAEVNSYSTNPIVEDTTGDGFTDGFLVDQGFDPVINYGALRTGTVDITDALNESRSLGQQDVTGDPGAYELYTTTEISDARSESRLLGQQDVTGDPGAYELFSESQVMDLRPDSKVIEVTNNEATIDLEMHQSNDLQTWSKVGESISMTVPADSSTMFFRHAFSSSDSTVETTLEFTFIGTNNHDFGAYYGNEAIISTANIPLHGTDSNIYYTTSYQVIEWSSSIPIGGSQYGRPTVTVAQTSSLVGYNLKIRFFKYDSNYANNFSSSGPILTIDGDALAQQEQTVLSASGIGVSSQLGYSVRVWKEAKP